MPEKKLHKKIKAKLTHKSDTAPVKIEIDDSARLKEIRTLVQDNNRSTLDENLVICQIYMESRFDASAGASHNAKGLMQMQKQAVQQIYKYRKQKEVGHMPSDSQTRQAFSENGSDGRISK